MVSDGDGEVTAGVDEVEARLGSRLAELDGLTETPVGTHAEVFERIHAALQDELAAIDGA